MLLKTKSWLPSSVNIFMAHPLTSLCVSAPPACGATVLTRSSTLLFLPTPFKNLALVRDEMSFVTSNSPQAPTARAWTTRSGILSREKWARVSMSWVSCKRTRDLAEEAGVLLDRNVCAVLDDTMGHPGLVSCAS